MFLLLSLIIGYLTQKKFKHLSHTIGTAEHIFQYGMC